MIIMKYEVNALYGHTEITVKTNDIDVAIANLLKFTEDGAHTNLHDGLTGEIYVITNYDEDYITEEWSFLILGWLMSQCFGF